MTDSNPLADAGPDEELSEEEKQELIQELERKRTLRGVTAVAVAAIGILFSLYQLWLAAQGFIFEFSVPGLGTVRLAALQQLQVNAIHVVFGLVLAFLLYPATAGDGFVSGAFARTVPELRRRFGAAHPVTRSGEGVARGVGWLAVDPDRDRVTPLDVVLIGLSLLSGWYIYSDFEEIQTLRALGIDSGRTVAEVYPFLRAPVEAVSALGVPLDEMSYAYLLGAIGILLVLEATRRTIGLALAVIVSLFLVYAHYGYLIPADIGAFSVFRTSSLSWASIVQNMWYTTGAIFGTPVIVSVQFIYIFILFGAFLETSGAGQWFIDLAYSLTGARKGGPAKASILSSGFMGTISGSSIANTVTTGAFTIPLMKRSGYRAEFAGAVEASASSGGQILPPVMGAAAFIMIEYVPDLDYSELIVAAAIPAVVFFFGVWVMVHLEASKVGVGGSAADDLVPLLPHAKRGWYYLAPIVLLLYFLIVERLSVARSAWYAIVAIAAVIALIAAYSDRTRLPLFGGIAAVFAAEVVALTTTGTDLLGLLGGAGGGGLGLGAAVGAALGKLGWIIVFVSLAVLVVRPDADAYLLDYDEQVDDAAAASASALGRRSLADNGAYRYATFLLKSLDSGARTATPIVIAVAAAGIIPGVLGATGLGSNLVSFMQEASGGSLPLLLLITAVGSIILGMGMPTTVTYIILASLLAPAVTEIAPEVPTLAAHLFILYFGVIADITPPVAVAAYAASGVAKSDPFDTGIEAFSLSLNKAIVPFAFVLSPGILLLRGDGDAAHVLNAGDLADLGFVVPEVLIPVAAVFAGVMALGPTIIGYLYTDVGRVERVGFALAALLLMAPGLLFTPVATLAGVDLAGSLLYDLALRGVGAAAFVGLAVRNRRAADAADEPAATAPAG